MDIHIAPSLNPYRNNNNNKLSIPRVSFFASPVVGMDLSEQPVSGAAPTTSAATAPLMAET